MYVLTTRHKVLHAVGIAAEAGHVYWQHASSTLPWGGGGTEEVKPSFVCLSYTYLLLCVWLLEEGHLKPNTEGEGSLSHLWGQAPSSLRVTELQLAEGICVGG